MKISEASITEVTNSRLKWMPPGIKHNKTTKRRYGVLSISPIILHGLDSINSQGLVEYFIDSPGTGYDQAVGCAEQTNETNGSSLPEERTGEWARKPLN